MTLLRQELAKTELLQDVSEELLQQVIKHAKPLELKPGTVLLSPELNNQHLYLLLSGTLTLHFKSLHTVAIREINKGYSVGELSIIDNTLPSAYVKAKNHCKVFPIHRDLLNTLIAGANPIARNLLRILSWSMKANTHRIVKDQSRILKLRNHANIDGLTGLYNRRWLDSAIARMLTQAIKHDRPLCILIIDVDDFKKYNDSQGHLGGDLALIKMADILKNKIRPFYFAARMGGEEFIVLLPNTNRSEGIVVAERIRLDIEKTVITRVDGSPMPGITVSIGVTSSHSDSTPESILAAADKQLYLAKQSGRNCVRYLGFNSEKP